jgi:hypothetical protein
MLIFGWGHQTRNDFGPTVPVTCSNCRNKCYLHLLHIRVWFTLFFIPVIPYESKHYLLCEICSRGIELQGEQVAKAKELNEATSAYLNNAMTEESYIAVVNAKQLIA